MAPALLYYDVTNAVYQQHRQKRIDTATVVTVMTAVLALPIHAYSDKEIHPAAHRLAARFTLPATYDAHYLATAEMFSADLWTADRKLSRAVRDELPGSGWLETGSHPN